jgi:hypothetical protein
MAGRIEVALEEQFGEEEPFASAVRALASYRPEGGPYLHVEIGSGAAERRDALILGRRMT